MATAKPIASTPPRRWARKLWLLPVAIVVGLAAWFWRPLNSYAVTGASYGARVVCSCRYIERRSLDSCRDDLEAGMELVHVTDDDETRSVTARFPLLSSQTARFREGEGCVLESWGD